MEKFGQFICKHKVAILIISLLLLIPSIIGYKATRVNYDILVYLPDNIETIKGENILADDFDMGAFSVVILENMQSKDIIGLEKQFREVGNVEKVVGLTDIIGTDVPLEMLPDEIKDKLYKDNTTPVLVTFKDGISEDTTMETVEKLREISNENCKISGMTATVLDTRNLSDSEVIIYVMIAVALCLIILQLALDSYLAPVLMLLNIGMAVLYNMGTNVFLGQTSYITKAISAVLQLGVTMDFAIFLYHSYKAEKEKASNNDEAMATAIAKTLVSVLGSSLTTIAGFLALCSMNLTLGKDIGLVMAKGVLIGVITAVTTLPAMLLVFDKWVEKTKHKEILPRFEKVKNFNLKHYKAILVAFIVILPFAVYGYTHTESYYNLSKSLPDTLNSIQANNELKDKFDMVSTELLLVDKNMPDYKLNEMLDKIESLDGIEWTLSYSKISKEVNIPKEMLPEDIRSIFESDKYQMVIINSKYEIATNELNSQIEEANKIIKEYDDTAILAGEGPLMKDLVEISDHDFNSVNTVSIAIILVIMVFVLKSVSLPIILIAAIEFAIFINMAIPAYTGTVIPFIASIVIGTIQLGATIDYAILITTKYKTARIEGKDKHQAIDEALGTSIQSIIVSALCFFGATFGVGMYSKIEMIGSCSLMARGAIISMVTVLTVLPAFLIVFDKIICKTTANMRKLSN